MVADGDYPCVFDLVIQFFAATPCGYYPSTFEQAQLLRDIGLAHPEHLRNLGYSERVGTKQVDDLEASGMGEGFDELCLGMEDAFGHTSIIFDFLNMSIALYCPVLVSLETGGKEAIVVAKIEGRKLLRSHPAVLYMLA